MTGIRNRSTDVPFVFRYPKWVSDIFYPAGSVVSHPVSGIVDSEVNYYNFYSAIRDIVPDQTPPPSNSNWVVIFDAALAASDSELLVKFDDLDSELKNAIINYRDADSDIKKVIQLLRDQRLDSDNIVSNADLDSEIRVLRHDFRSGDSDVLSQLTSGLDSDIASLRDYDSDFKVKYDSDIAKLKHDYKAGDSDVLSQLTSGLDSDIALLRSFDSDLLVSLDSDYNFLREHQQLYGKATEVIPKGSVVEFAGVQGDHILFRLARLFDPNFKPEFIIGVVQHEVPNNGFAFITTQGRVDGLNTNGFEPGDLLYVSPTIPGQLTNVKPSSPQKAILMAAVLRKNASVGEIFVRITFGQTLEESHDVLINTLEDGQVLAWDDSDKVWKNVAISTIVGSGFDFGNF